MKQFVQRFYSRAKKALLRIKRYYSANLNKHPPSYHQPLNTATNTADAESISPRDYDSEDADRESFVSTLIAKGDQDMLSDFCKKYLLHGTPYVFRGREDDYFEFRSRIANHFAIGFHEVFIVGSAKLGFSPFKNKSFDYDSDIDVAIVSERLFDMIMEEIRAYQSQLRRSRLSITTAELKQYHSFLEYVALGWIRPDKLRLSFNVSKLRESWFNFFKSISNGASEVGNYHVSAGVFKTYLHLEKYQIEGLEDLYQSEKVKDAT